MAEENGSNSSPSPSPSPMFIPKQSFVWERKRNKVYSKKKRKPSKSPNALNSPEFTFEFKNDTPQDFGDHFFLSGDIPQSVPYYTTMLEEQIMVDTNNNSNGEDNNELEWSNTYLTSKLSEVEKMIEIYPRDPSLYLQKAAVLFFQDRWAVAREVLSLALTKCSDKSEIRAAIGNLNKLERSLAVCIG